MAAPSTSSACHQRQLILVVEGTAALGQYWNSLRLDYIEKIVRSFHGMDTMSQKSPGAQAELALVVYHSHGSHNGCLVQQSGWTTNIDLFWKWLSSINFSGGGFGEVAVAEGLAEALLMCCPNPPVSQVIERQKHCLLVAASNPHRLPTPILRPPVHNLMQPSTTGDPLAEHWWLTDADTVAKAFAQCLVSLSVISPRQLPSLKSIFNGAKRNARATDSPVDNPKYPYHMVLLSESFIEARLSLTRSTGSAAAVPPVGLPKIEPTSVTSAPIAVQSPALNVRATTVTPGVAGRQGAANGVMPAHTVKSEAASMPAMAPSAGLSHPVSAAVFQNTTPAQVAVPHSSTAVTTPEVSATAESIVTQEFKPLGTSSVSTLRPNGVSAGGAMLLPNSSQVRPIMSTTGLSGSSSAGLPGSTISSTGLSLPGILASSSASGTVSTSQSMISTQQSGLGLNNNQVGLGAGLGMTQGVGLGTFGNTASLTGNSNLGPLPSVAGGLSGISNMQVAGLGQTVSGLGQGLTGSNQVGQSGLVMGHNALPGIGPVGVNSGGGTMIPTPGLSQQAVQGLQSLPGANNNAANPLHVQPTVATPPQMSAATGASKYAKVWEGMLTGQRQGKPVFICKLEGFRQASSPETLAADWPPSMQICRLIAQDHMNSKNYQGKSELLIFKTMGQHGFLVQLAEKKLCAVIQLPSQTLLLASSDKQGRMIGMLFPGDMVVFKPQLPSQQQQQAASASSGIGQTFSQTQSASSGIGQTFSQNQLPGQVRPQLMQSGQLSGQGPASLQGSSFLS